MIIRDLFSKRE